MSILLLAFTGLVVGLLSSIAGVGGGFVVTPALIIIGFPTSSAVGTSLAWVTSNSIVATLSHGKIGNVDLRLGMTSTIGTLCGIEVGVRCLNWCSNLGLEEFAVLLVYVIVLGTLGFFTLLDAIKSKSERERQVTRKTPTLADTKPYLGSKTASRLDIPPLMRLPKSNLTVSIWVILAVFFLIGIMIGFLGVGGGFVIVPSLIYFFGLLPNIAAGTSIFQTIFAGSYGTIRYSLSGDVAIYYAVIMLMFSSIGVYFGTLTTRHISGIFTKFVLSSTMLITMLGALMKLLHVLCGSNSEWLRTLAATTILGGTAIITLLICIVFVISIRHGKGKPIPFWVTSLIEINGSNAL